LLQYSKTQSFKFQDSAAFMSGTFPIHKKNGSCEFGLRHRNSTSGSVLQSAYNLYIVKDGDVKNPIPLTIPPDVTLQYIKEILKATEAVLLNGMTWDDVEFCIDEKCWFPLNESSKLHTLIKDQQTLFLHYKNRGKLDVTVIIPMRKRPLRVKKLPSHATVGGLMELMKSVLDPDEINMDDFWLCKEGSVEKLPKTFLLDRLKPEEKLVAESNVDTWKVLAKQTKYSWKFWTILSVSVLLFALFVGGYTLYMKIWTAGRIIGELRQNYEQMIQRSVGSLSHFASPRM